MPQRYIVRPSAVPVSLPEQTQTVTVTTDRDTFVVEHIFDLGGVSSLFGTVTLLSLSLDGEVLGLDPGDIVPDTYQYAGSDDGVTFTSSRLITTSPSYILDDQYTGGTLPAVTHRFFAIVPRFLKVVHNIIDGSSFDRYAGPNHPTATVRIDVDYL